jgi:hypothetical protein
MFIVRIFGIALVTAVATWFLGWWSVPVVCALYSFMRPAGSRPVRDAALGAMLGWAALFAWQVSHPSFGRLSNALAGVFPVPAPVLMLVAVLFIGLLAGAAARVTMQQRRPVNTMRVPPGSLRDHRK